MNGMDYGDQLTSSRDPILSGKHALELVKIDIYFTITTLYLQSHLSTHQIRIQLKR